MERHVTILLVEDNPADAYLVKDTLATAPPNKEKPTFVLMHVQWVKKALALLASEDLKS
jgi:hypothetical protein